MPSISATLTLLAAGAALVKGLAVTGVQGATYPRYEIRTLKNQHADQYALYVQALQAFQNVDQSDVGSYYQISGIHGQPNVPWDGQDGSGGGIGYCTHSMNLFPTWHRPYVALFEQQLQAQAVTIANQYPESDRQRWTDAATQLRAPYYDWAISPNFAQPVYPDVLSQPTVSIETPSGQQTVNNPLYSYRFPNEQDSFGDPYRTWPNTLRYPTSGNSDASSQQDLAGNALGAAQPNQKSGVYQLMTNCPAYDDMSNDQDANSNGCSISLESLHNNFHVQIGGDGSPAGHMTIVPISGFDPSFMLHHCMVDRLFAIWQVLHPDSYTSDKQSSVSTYTIQQGSTQGPDSPLTPFRDGNGFPWTSNGVRDTNVFHYTYPELQAANGDIGAMQNQVNMMYGPQSSQTAAKRSIGRRQILDGLLAPNGSSFEYKVNIATSKYALDGPYSIYVFFNDPSNSKPSTWGGLKDLVGSYGVFAAPGMKGTNVISSSVVSLTEALSKKVDAGELKSLDPTVVVPYLTKNLQWRVAQGGKELKAADVPGLRIGVVSSTLASASSTLENVVGGALGSLWSPFNLLEDITKGKAGGLS